MRVIETIPACRSADPIADDAARRGRLLAASYGMVLSLWALVVVTAPSVVAIAREFCASSRGAF